MGLQLGLLLPWPSLSWMSGLVVIISDPFYICLRLTPRNGRADNENKVSDHKADKV